MPGTPIAPWKERSNQMTKTYYAICNVNGPISVRLAGETRKQALAAFAALDTREIVGQLRTPDRLGHRRPIENAQG